MKEVITVSNMTCKHCEARITKALQENSIAAEVNLEDKTVVVAAEDVVKAKEVITASGYQAS